MRSAVSESHDVELRDVVKEFGEVRAVDHVSMQIRDGEFFAMLGPSGCGKTTCLRMIAGFELPTYGDVVIKGKPQGATPPYKRNVNTVFQSYALFPHMTVADNVAFGLQMRGVPKAEVTRRVQEALAMVRLEALAARKPRQMSGGQQQRVALARALVNRPDVLLLDEPLGALDQKLRKDLQFELRNLQEQVGITFVFVTHDQEEALTMADRIAVMSQGKVLQIGTPTEIYERPNCRFVADFIGETNFINGRVTSLEQGYAVVETALGNRVRGIMPRQVELHSEVTVSVRPEKARLSVDNTHVTDNLNCYPVTVERVAYIGSDTRILVRVHNAEREFSVWEPNLRSTLDREEYWQRGDSGWLTWPAENALVLTD
jgi:spermidine/putrescine transport system ATP-binding protein